MADLKIARVFELPQDVAAALHDHCCETGDKPADVVADAVALLLDAAVHDFDPDLEAAEEAAEVTVEVADFDGVADAVLRLVP